MIVLPLLGGVRPNAASQHPDGMLYCGSAELQNAKLNKLTDAAFPVDSIPPEGRQQVMKLHGGGCASFASSLAHGIGCHPRQSARSRASRPQLCEPTASPPLPDAIKGGVFRLAGSTAAGVAIGSSAHEMLPSISVGWIDAASNVFTLVGTTSAGAVLGAGC